MNKRAQSVWQQLLDQKDRTQNILGIFIKGSLQARSSGIPAPVSNNLEQIDKALERAYHQLQDIPAQTSKMSTELDSTENEVFDTIRTLEDQRFQLLSQLHGSHIERYNSQPH